MRLVFFLLLFCLCSCRSDPYMLPESDMESTAPAAAWAADSMTFRKVMPDRRDQKPWVFYYKHCNTTGEEVYFSKTVYDCTAPYY